MSRNIYSALLIFTAILFSIPSFAQDHKHDGHDHSGHDHSGHDHSGHDHSGHNHDSHAGHDHASHEGHDHELSCGHHDEGHAYDPAATAIHHISDGNVWSVLEYPIPLPMILKSDSGWDVFMSSKFGAHFAGHENGEKSYNGYVLYEGSAHRVVEPGFPMEGSVDIGHHAFTHQTVKVDGKEKEEKYVCYQNKPYRIESRTTLDGGMVGGGITSFWDFSPTKNVIAMILVSLLLFFMFRGAARKYKENPLKAPSGVQGILETMVLFIRDEVAIPFIGKKKYMKFFPFLLAIFFFILGLNLFGQVPFLGSVNASGNLTLTMVLALIGFLIVNFNGNKDYWKHIFWMPGVPTFVKPLLAFVEGLGVFIKPLTLMLRLAGNISAGHIAILSFIGLIYIFGDLFGTAGNPSTTGNLVGTALSVPLTLFMMAIELIVAFVQAFVFTILTASYIGAATEEHHH